WEFDLRERHLLTAEAWQLTVPDAVASHWTAALAHRLPAPTRLDGRPRFPTFFHPRRSGTAGEARFIEGSVDSRDIVRVGALVATSPLRTALDVAVHRPLSHALVVLDAAVRMVVVERLPPGS